MPVEPVVQLRGVTVVFAGHTALTGIDLEVTAGERVAVIGPSGAGKSTLIGLLNGTVTATSGVVRVLGCDYTASTARQIRKVQRGLGTIHQRFDLVGQLRTVHNVNAGRLAAWPLWKAALSLVVPRDVGTVDRALERVGIADKRDVRTAELSGGEQQRVAIARILVQQPVAVLADEPVASLDPARGKEIIDLLHDISIECGTTLLACLHQVDLALHRFERVIGLREGRVLFDAAPADLDADRLAELYDLDRRQPA